MHPASRSVARSRLKVLSDRFIYLVVSLTLLFCGYPILVLAQEPVGKSSEPQSLPGPRKKEVLAAPTKVDVNPVAHDEEISERLQSVLNATEWFTEPRVRVKEGIVFLSGPVKSEELKKWAGDLARNTQDVAASTRRLSVALKLEGFTN